MQNLQDVVNFLESLLTVTVSESIGTSCGMNLESQTRYNYVNIIKGTETDEEVAENSQIILDEVNFENNCYTGWLEWSNTFYDRACVTVTQCTNVNMLNAFYNIEEVKKIKRLINYTAPQKKKLFTGLDHVYLIFLGSLNPNMWSV